MKRFLKAISVLSITLMFVLTLASCNQNKFYKEWSKAGAAIEEENIFEYIELDEVASKITNRDTFVVVYASSENTNAVNVISSLQAQYDYLCTKGEERTVYVVDSTDIDKSSERTNAKEKLGLTKAVNSTGEPIVITYIDGQIDVESNYEDKNQTKEFILNGSFEYSSFASYIFKELLA